MKYEEDSVPRTEQAFVRARLIPPAVFLQCLRRLDQPAGQLDLLQNLIRDLAVIGIASGCIVRLRRVVSALLQN